MIARARTFTVESRWPPRAAEATVEVDVRGGLPSFTIIGLPASAVSEHRERVRAALLNSGYEFPNTRITVNITPAPAQRATVEIQLAIASALLVASGQLDAQRLATHALLGELSLDGVIRASEGALLAAEAARDAGCKALVLAGARAREAAAAGLEVIVADRLPSAVRVLDGGPGDPPPQPATPTPATLDLSDIRAHPHAIQALTLAAAGGHSLLLIGPRGAGTMTLAGRLPGILAPPSHAEALQITRLHGLRLRTGQGLIETRPFRAPHHSLSAAGLTGGGRRYRLGEAQLATHGVLFLDELEELTPETLDALHGLLERRRPAGEPPLNITILAAARPCPCGFAAESACCTCTAADHARHRQRLKATIERFDMVANLKPPRPDETFEPPPASQEVRERVLNARALQYQHLLPGDWAPNAQIGRGPLGPLLVLSPSVQAHLRDACRARRLSDRQLDSVLRVARTAADLDASTAIEQEHLSTALSYTAPAPA